MSEDAQALMDRVVGSSNHYDTLGVTKDDEEKALKKAYRKLALQIHPDKCQLHGAEEAFKKVSNAYGTLSSADSRSHYDQFGNDAPASRSGPDPYDFFQDFCAQNPDFAAGWTAGAPQGTGGDGIHSFADFNFSAGTLAAGRNWWEHRSHTLSAWMRGPFRGLGVVVFAAVGGFFATMPYSAMAVGGVALFVASKAVWWILNRAVWLMAMGKLPSKIKPRFVLQVIVLLAAEYGGVVFDFQRGLLVFMALVALANFTGGASASSGFSFQTGPGFVQFGSRGHATNNMGRGGRGVGNGTGGGRSDAASTDK